MRNKYGLMVFVGTCLLMSAMHVSAELDVNWGRLWGSPVNDYGHDVDIYGGSTEIYVCGQTFGSFDSQTAISSMGDACLSRFNFDGTRPWSRIWGSVGSDDAMGVAVDPGSGEMYVVGCTEGSFGVGQTNSGMLDAFCSKFDAAGNLLWSRIWGSTMEDRAEAVVIGASGMVYVAGSTYGAFDGQTNSGLSDIFVTCINSTGDREWSLIWGSSMQDECKDVSLLMGPPDQLFVTGWTMGSFDGQPSIGMGDIFLSNIDIATKFRNFSLIWGSSQNDEGHAVSVDMMSADVYVAGRTMGAIGIGQTNSGSSDFVLTRLSIGGTMFWSRTWGSPLDDSASAMRSGFGAATNNNIIVIGNTHGSFAGIPNPQPGSSAFAMSMFDSAGTLHDARIWGSTGSDFAEAVVVDGIGDVYVAGFSDGDFAGQTNHGQNDMALTRFSPASGSDRYVAPNGGHVWPYTSWVNAATSIHDAVMASFSGDIIRVSNGVYVVDAPVVLTNDVRLESVNGPLTTVIDGGSFIRCLQVEHGGSVVCGFTLQDGYDPGGGGGIYLSQGLVQRCIVTACSAASGGGVYITGGEIQNSLIANNEAMMYGGGIYQSGGGYISSCTIASNYAATQAGGLHAEGGMILNTIIDGNTATADDNIYNSSITPAMFNHCCSVPLIGGVNNLAGPAQFVAPSAFDFKLAGSSPCINQGTNEFWMAAETDLGTHPRIINSIVDLGAYEYMSTSFVVSTSGGGHGAILPTQSVVNAGGSATFNIYPDAGYEVLDVMVNNVSVGPTNAYTFVNVTSNQLLSATYTIQMFDIISTGVVDGVITPPTAIVSYGGSQSFSISPDSGYVIADVFVDGFSVGITSNFIFTNVMSDKTISAHFSTNVPTYSIVASADPGGAVLPPNALVPAGDNQTFDIIPDAGFHIVDVFVDGLAVGAVTSYTFNSVFSNHTIAASFSSNMVGYYISTIAGPDGHISPPSANVPAGGNQNFVIVPDAGYMIHDVRVNGVSVGQTNVYLFTGVDSNQLLAASFVSVTSTFQIVSTAGPHGSVSPSNAVVPAGGSQTVTITPDAGFFVQDVMVNGHSVGAVTSYTFNPVFGPSHLFASFDSTGPGSLYGQVEGSGVILSNAHVELRNSDNETVYDAFTDYAGHYAITGIAPGGYRIKVSHEDFADVWYDGAAGTHYIADAVAYHIVGGGTGSTVDFELQPGQSPALMEVTSSPTGLPVYLDFQPTGLRTPAVLAIGEAGSGYNHILWVKGDGLPYPSPVHMAGIEAETEKVHFTLTAADAGYLNVSTTPDGADVFLDCTDAPIAVSPCGPFALAPGKHMVIIRKGGYLLSWPVEVEILAGVTRSVDVPLTPVNIFRDDFGEGFGAWNLFGSPQSQLVDVHGHQGVFDNNGDAVCDSGIISKPTMDLRGGCTIKSEVYLEVIDPASCWVHGAIALASGQRSTGYCDTFENIGLIEFAMIGNACTEIPAALRGHSYIWGPGMDISHFNADQYVNGWHTLAVEIDVEGEVKLYLDEQLIGTAPVQLSVDSLADTHLLLGRRSSGSGGKFYMDNIVVKQDVEDEIIQVNSQPDAATIYLDFLPVNTLTDTELNGFDPMAYHGDGWQSISHRIMLSKMGYVHTAPRSAPPDVSVKLLPAVGAASPSIVFYRAMKDPRDLDGDKRTDVSCYDEAAGMWYMHKSRGGFDDQQFGFGGTLPVSGDYDGDGIQDVTVFWPEGGMWYILQSSDDALRIVNWGWPDVWPVPGDYDGDQKTDIAVFWPDLGMWFIQLSETGASRAESWGWSQVVPVVADYDGDGYSDISVYWPEGGRWYILQSALQEAVTLSWGWHDTQPVPADFDGDGRADIAVYWPQGGNWYILQSGDGRLRMENWGWNESWPVSGDYDGDGKADITVYWPAGAYWYLLKSREGMDAIPLGTCGAVPIQ